MSSKLFWSHRNLEERGELLEPRTHKPGKNRLPCAPCKWSVRSQGTVSRRLEGTEPVLSISMVHPRGAQNGSANLHEPTTLLLFHADLSVADLCGRLASTTTLSNAHEDVLPFTSLSFSRFSSSPSLSLLNNLFGTSNKVFLEKISINKAPKWNPHLLLLLQRWVPKSRRWSQTWKPS